MLDKADNGQQMKAACWGRPDLTTQPTTQSRPLPRAEERAQPCCLLCLRVRPRKPGLGCSQGRLWSTSTGLGPIMLCSSHHCSQIPHGPHGSCPAPDSPPKYCSLLLFHIPGGGSLSFPNLAALFSCAKSNHGGFKYFTHCQRCYESLRDS